MFNNGQRTGNGPARVAQRETDPLFAVVNCKDFHKVISPRNCKESFHFPHSSFIIQPSSCHSVTTSIRNGTIGTQSHHEGVRETTGLLCKGSVSSSFDWASEEPSPKINRVTCAASTC